MTPEKWRRIEGLLEKALELPPSESEAFLARACGSDDALRREVESLIEADQRAGKFIARPILEFRETQTTTVQEPVLPSPASDGAPDGPRADVLDDGLYPSGTVLAERYRTVSFLGRGGMGEVYRADDLKLDQPVALKFLSEPLQQDPASLSRLKAEVKIARRVSHPNVCRVHDVGEADGRHFLSMEYIEGEDLASLLLRIGRLPQDKALEIAQQLCHGLAAAHRQDVLHRDLKPGNLMIDGRGQARITDFGIAAPVGRVTGVESRCGTPVYMAPEQLAGEEVSIRSDLYALGLVLYELFTGQRAIASESMAPPIGQSRQAAIVPPSRLVAGLAMAIEEVILSCLEENPRDRPASAEAVAAALAAQAAGREWLPEPGLAVPHRPSWRLVRKLGAGGFGEVWLAGHQKTRERRVFKLGRGAQGRRTLQREIAVFRLLKEGLGDRGDIARILDWNVDEPPYYIEAEYTDGGNLIEWIEARGGLAAVPLADRLEIVAQVATALAAAHSVGVLHKDVKPTNVLITHDREPEASAGRLRAQLIDFGLGAITERRRWVEAGITVPRSAIAGESGDFEGGTQLYMAPELLEGKSATLQSDVYALGVMLYQVVVGDFARVLAPGWRRDVDDELLCDDIAGAVDGAPELRLADARDLARRLRSLEARRAERERQRQSQVAAKRTREALEKSYHRRKLTAMAIGVLTLVATALGLLASLIAREKKRAEQEASRAKNIARVAVAGEWLQKDPTTAAVVLREVEKPREIASAISQMRQVLSQRLATMELRGHAGSIKTAVWSSSGDKIVTTASDQTARVWSIDGGEPTVLEHSEQLLTAWLGPGGRRVYTLSVNGRAREWQVDGTGGSVLFESPDSSLQAAAVGPRGELLVTGSWLGAVRFWQVAADSVGVHLGNHDGPVTAVSFDPQGERVVSVSQDGTARVWDISSGDHNSDEVAMAHGEVLRTASFSPRGDRVLTVGASGTVRVWSTEGSPDPVVFGIDIEGERQVEAAWSPDDARVFIAARGRAWIWNLEGPEEPIVLEGHEDVVAAAFSPVGDRVLVASGYGTARVSAVDGSGESIVFKGHYGIVRAAFDPTGEKVLTASRQGTVRVWDLGRAVEPSVLDHREAVRQARWSPDGKRVVTVPQDGAPRVWNVGDFAGWVPLEGHGDIVLSASWSPDGQRVATASSDGTARIWRVESGADPIVLAGHDDRVFNASWSPSGERVVTASADGTARVWRSTGSTRPIVLGPHEDAVTAAVWSPAGELIATTTASGTTAHLWNLSGSAEPIALEGHYGAIEVISFGPRGARVLTGSVDGTARVWDVDGSGEPIVLDGHDDFIFAAAFAPGGDRVLTATAGGIVRLWNIEAPGEAVVLDRHRGAVNHVSWSSRGDLIATVAEDGTASIWQSDGKSEPMVLEGHAGAVVDVSWSPEGDRILTASRDGTARIWRAGADDLIAAIREATRVCLVAEFRERRLGDSPEEAQRRYLECAPGHS